MIPPLLAGKTYAAFDGEMKGRPLSDLSMELLSEQKETWPDLEQGYALLKEIRVREIDCGNFSVRVQHNPGRARSTMADVAEESINGRPCFLCLGNLPERQKGILYREEYLILCNPMPIFAGHLTISHCIHQPQLLVGQVDAFLGLMKDFGDSWTVLYNGPRCGASAPDHLHFQSIPSKKMPAEKEICAAERLIPVGEADGTLVSLAEGLGREIVVVEGDKRDAVAGVFRRIVTAWQKVSETDSEPMMNVAGSHDGEKWRLMVFPRVKHRPAAFFREGDARIVVSPPLFISCLARIS